MAARLLLSLLFLVASAEASALRSASGADAAANPIRKVVSLLQSMQKKVEEEGVKGQELYDKFMCFCKNAGGDLKASITAADTKIPAVGASIKEAEAQKTGAEADLKAAQVDRSEAKAAMATATAIREKEAAAYAAEKSMYDTNIAALGKATKAIEGGLLGSFLQTSTAEAVRRLALDSQDMEQQDRQDILAFLSGKDEAPSSGEIVGILKQMSETMSKSLAEATSVEEGAIKTYESLMASKEKEVDVLTSSIEAKTVQIGELGISIVSMKNDLTETEAQLLEDQAFLADLAKSCKSKTAEWDEAKKMRAEELAAISETIKVLNDDDSLELFKKTLPGASSFMQIQENSERLRARALAAVQAGLQRGVNGRVGRTEMGLISLALRGKTIGFEKVIAMIDEMVGTLKKEQLDDDHKKEYCAAQFDFAEDKKKSLERKIADETAAIESAEEGVATLAEEIKALTDGIKALDKEVAAATEQRKEEAAAFTELMASDSAAKEVLLFAKNRLNKFYNPKLYNPPPKRVLSSEDEIVVSMGGTLAPTQPPGGIAGTGISLVEVHAHTQKVAQPEGPAAYAKQSESNTGVIAMIDLLVKDLDKQMQESEVEEKDAKADYASMMKDSADKRAQDSSSLVEKEAAKADLEAALEGHKESKAGAGKELMGTEGYISSLHAECDWLLKYFDVRKSARDEEIDGLGKAKAVLSGADYSLLQTARSRGFLAK